MYDLCENYILFLIRNLTLRLNLSPRSRTNQITKQKVLKTATRCHSPILNQSNHLTNSSKNKHQVPLTKLELINRSPTLSIQNVYVYKGGRKKNYKVGTSPLRSETPPPQNAEWYKTSVFHKRKKTLVLKEIFLIFYENIRKNVFYRYPCKKVTKYLEYFSISEHSAFFFFFGYGQGVCPSPIYGLVPNFFFTLPLV